MTRREPSEHALPTLDGTELFYRAWLAPGAEQGLVLFHRGHEHSGRLQDLVDRLDLPDVSVFAWDARGHGRSAGERGGAPSFGGLVRDADAFVRFVHDKHGIPIDRMVVMAHSLGSVIAAAWVHDYAPPLRGMVLGCPAFRVKLYLPFAIPLLRLLARLRGRASVSSYIMAGLLTHDRERAAQYRRDPLVTRAIAVNVLLGLHDASTRILADAGAIDVPTLVLAAGSDRVVRLAPQRRFVQRLSSATRSIEVYPGFYHGIFDETGRAEPIARARRFIREVLAGPPADPRRLAADRHGYTHAEYQRLRQPLPAWSPRGLAFAALRGLLATAGRLSEGVRRARRTGFDSGVSLDYVYENHARGTGLLGRWLDRRYLDAVGWRAIRRRKANLERVLRDAVERVTADGQPVHLVDVAAGPGRYVLDLLRTLPAGGATALLRDRDPENLAAGRRLAAALGLRGVTHAEGDAFDAEGLARLAPAPTIAVASGLYELFPANEPIMRSLRGLHAALRPGGYLVYTNQPWHPQVELIARVLRTREGQPWVMRRRTQAEMDELVRQAGFEKLDTAIDEDGIFSVSLARRPG